MMKGIIGKKLGMTQIFNEQGQQIPVTVVEAAPNPVTNATFVMALAAAVHRPALLPVPAGMLRMIFGEMADETMLASQRVLPQRLAGAGFRFEDEEIGTAFRALLR